MSETRTVTLTGGGPWGFRIQGGRDFNTPLSISRVNDGGKAHLVGLLTGETITEINGNPTAGQVHVSCQKLIKNTGTTLSLTIDRSTARPNAPAIKAYVPPPKVSIVTKTQFTPLHQQVTAPKPEPHLEKPSAVAAALARHSPSPPPIPSPPPESMDFPPPPPTNFSQIASSSSFSSDLSFPQPPKPEPVKTHFIPKAPSIIERPSVLSSRREIEKASQKFDAKPVFPKSFSKLPSPGSSSSTVPSSFSSNQNQFSAPIQPKTSMTMQMNNLKLANDPAGRKYVSPEISPTRPPVTRQVDHPPPSPPVVAPVVAPPSLPKQQPKPAAIISQSILIEKDHGEREPTCAVCAQRIRGQYCQAIGKNWHPQCFKCQSPGCEVSLQAAGFIEDAGCVYCRNCFERDIAHCCAKCNKKIIGDTMHALNQTWHMHCFVCVKCRRPFEDGVFHWQNEQPYCVDDYNQLFATFCRGCNMRVEAGDQYIEALGHSWHDNCFTCSTCHCKLKNVGFYNRNNMPVCKAHAR